MKLRTIAEAAELIRKGEVSPVELLRECLETIERLNPSLNALVTVTADSAFAQARKAEQEIQAGQWRSVLHGIPIGLKDLIDTAGVTTTAASGVFRDRVPAEDADVVTKLKAAGAVLLGKQNLHEFAYGGSSVISHFGAVRNPVNPEFIAGGSSGGSAAAAASGMCYGAIGTDTSGSIREPAALCGVVGLKPSYGLVGVRGIIPLSPSLDHAGPITRTVEDAAIVLDAIVHPRSSKYRKSLKKDIGGYVLGIPKRSFFEDMDEEVKLVVDRAIHQLSALTREVREIDLPLEEDRTVQRFEAYAYHRQMVASSPELYDPETLRRIREGERISQERYWRALDELRKIRAEIPRRFEQIGVAVTPTTPVPAPEIARLMRDKTLLRPAELVLLRNTRPANVWGLPAISVPCGANSRGLPIGLQLIGPPDGDANVLQVAHAYQQETSGN